MKYFSVALALQMVTACTGPDCWSCPDPYESTECVESSWTGWRNDEEKFQKVCKGDLVRWGDDSGVQDCGVACFGCSWIRACCNTCKEIESAVGSWDRIRCTDVEMNVEFAYGLVYSQSESWSRTEEWSQSVSAKVTAGGEADGVTGSVELSAEAKHQLTETESNSWSTSKSEQTVVKYTQPAGTCAWHWKTTIEDSCDGVKVAYSQDFITTSGDQEGNPPCCLPGIGKDPNTGKCMPNNAGEVISLCGDAEIIV